MTDPGALGAWFRPERPGPMIYSHAVATGLGRCGVDRWPDPRAVLVELPGNVALRGDPDAFGPADLAGVNGFVDAPPGWLPRLRASDAGVGVWSRIVATLPGDVRMPGLPLAVRRLLAPDARALATLEPGSAWIHSTWGGPDRLCAAGTAWAAFDGDRVVSVAVPFFVGAAYEDIGVVTEPGHRGRGLSTACAAALVGDIRARSRQPSWSTSPDNTASLAIAARLGFVRQRDDVLYAVRVPIPV